MRKRLTATLLVGGLVLAAGLPPAPAPAAETPVKQAGAAPRPDPAKAAFDDLPEGTRRAIQDALIWTGDSNSSVTGSFGPRTREAILAFAKRNGLPATGLLDAAGRQKLLADAEAQRQAVGFAMVEDDHTGLRIGLPRKMLGRSIATASGSRYSASDGSIVVDTLSRPLGSGGLAEVFDRMTVETDKRSVTYKLLRPDFFVVSGTSGDQKFYARFAVGMVGGVATVRGVTLLYAKAVAKRLDPVSLAVAASFDPFPGQAPAVAAAGPAASARPPLPPRSPAAAQPIFAANAVMVAPGVALTAVSSAACPAPSVGGHAASFKAQDAGSGLVLLDVPGAAGAPIRLAPGAVEPSRRLFALFHTGATPSLAAAAVESTAGPEVTAPFQGGAAGAALIDDANALAGLAQASSKPPHVVAGIILASRYRVTDAPQIAAFLGRFGIATLPPEAATPQRVDLGDAGAAWRGSVAPVFCTPKV